MNISELRKQSDAGYQKWHEEFREQQRKEIEEKELFDKQFIQLCDDVKEIKRKLNLNGIF